MAAFYRTGTMTLEARRSSPARPSVVHVTYSGGRAPGQCGASRHLAGIDLWKAKPTISKCLVQLVRVTRAGVLFGRPSDAEQSFYVIELGK